MERIWAFDVAFTESRPIVVDEFRSRVKVLASDYSEATFLAVGLIDRDKCEMVTSTTYVE